MSDSSVDIPTKPLVWYYVETAIIKDSAETLAERTTFRSHLVQATKPKEAEAVAIGDARRAHPKATEVEVFMSRRLTDTKAEKIRQQFEDGTWEGWRF